MFNYFFQQQSHTKTLHYLVVCVDIFQQMDVSKYENEQTHWLPDLSVPVYCIF